MAGHMESPRGRMRPAGRELDSTVVDRQKCSFFSEKKADCMRCLHHDITVSTS